MKMLMCTIALIALGQWYEQHKKVQPKPEPIARYSLVMETSGSHTRIYQVPK